MPADCKAELGMVSMAITSLVGRAIRFSERLMPAAPETVALS